jgi:hypothetical protein
MTNKNEKLRPLLKVEKLFLTQTTGSDWMNMDAILSQEINEFLHKNLHKPLYDMIKEEFGNTNKSKKRGKFYWLKRQKKN